MQISRLAARFPAKKYRLAKNFRQPQLVKKVFLTSWWPGEQAPPPLPPLPVSAKILRIFGRGNCKEAIFALENGIFRRKNCPVPAVHAAGDD